MSIDGARASGLPDVALGDVVFAQFSVTSGGGVIPSASKTWIGPTAFDTRSPFGSSTSSTYVLPGSTGSTYHAVSGKAVYVCSNDVPSATICTRGVAGTLAIAAAASMIPAPQ